MLGRAISVRRHSLILGGARSGKTRHAEELGRKHPGDRVYIATAEPGDEEMRVRIALHRQNRGDGWRTVEEPLAVAEVLKRECAADRFVLVDCISLWISNLLFKGLEVRPEVDQLCALIPDLDGRVVIVSNEVGLGIVPASELGRRFRDEAGFANQLLAHACDEVLFMIAGMPLRLKDEHAS
jgi:adenosylcobinamide kinase/adenosylcobinamide-phosphate guanylyltransferase